MLSKAEQRVTPRQRFLERLVDSMANRDGRARASTLARDMGIFPDDVEYGMDILIEGKFVRRGGWGVYEFVPPKTRRKRGLHRVTDERQETDTCIKTGASVAKIHEDNSGLVMLKEGVSGKRDFECREHETPAPVTGNITVNSKPSAPSPLVVIEKDRDNFTRFIEYVLEKSKGKIGYFASPDEVADFLDDGEIAAAIIEGSMIRNEIGYGITRDGLKYRARKTEPQEKIAATVTAAVYKEPADRSKENPYAYVLRMFSERGEDARLDFGEINAAVGNDGFKTLKRDGYIRQRGDGSYRIIRTDVPQTVSK